MKKKDEIQVISEIIDNAEERNYFLFHKRGGFQMKLSN